MKKKIESNKIGLLHRFTPRNDNDVRYWMLDVGCWMVFISIVCFSTSVLGQSSGIRDPGSGDGEWVLVIHGGAGGVPKGSMSEEREKQYMEKLTEALQVGAAILDKGGSSLDAVESVIIFMEDCPLFNAGKGAVYNDEGFAELDASIMDGKTLMAGAVTGVKTIKHPISAAREVMTNTKHVLLMGEGAELFAEKRGLEIVDPSYFLTQRRTEQFERAKKKLQKKEATKGTVGAVALDREGNLAAGTSTGGMMMKMKGRIGDTPIIGAGTYANNATCAVSGTGHGEYFIRNSVAFDMSALMEYTGMCVKDAAHHIILEKLKSQGGSAGLIAVDQEGTIAMEFNTNAMFRGYAKETGEKAVMIY